MQATLNEVLLSTIGSTSTQVRSRRYDGTAIFYGGLINKGLLNSYQVGQFTLPSKPGNSGYPTQQYADYAITDRARDAKEQIVVVRVVAQSLFDGPT